MNKRALILVILFAAVSLSACANNPASTADGTGAEVEASTATTAESGDTKETEGMTGSTPPASSFEPVTEVPTESTEAESTASPNTAAPESSEKPLQPRRPDQRSRRFCRSAHRPSLRQIRRSRRRVRRSRPSQRRSRSRQRLLSMSAVMSALQRATVRASAYLLTARRPAAGTRPLRRTQAVSIWSATSVTGWTGILTADLPPFGYGRWTWAEAIMKFS